MAALKDCDYVLTSLKQIRLIVKAFREQELLSMQVAIGSNGAKYLKVIHPGHWGEGLWKSFTAIMENYVPMAPLVRQLVQKHKGVEWDKIRLHWFTAKFLELIAGLVDICHTLKVAEKALQEHVISFTTRDKVMDRMEQQLKEPMGTRPTFASVKHNIKRAPDRRTYYKGLHLMDNGAAPEMLRTIRIVILSQLKARMANRGVVVHLKWLDLSKWPEKLSDLADFAIADIEACMHTGKNV